MCPPAIKPGRPIRHRHFSASPRSPGGLYTVSWPWLGCGRVSDSATAVVPDSVCRVGVGHHCAAERDFSTTKALSLRRGSDIAAAIPMAAIARRVGTAREASPVRRPPTLLPFHLAACAHNERKGDTPRPLGPGFNLRLGGQGHSFFVYSSRRRLMQSCMCTGAAQRRRLRRPIMIMTDKAGAFHPWSRAICGSAEKGLQSLHSSRTLCEGDLPQSLPLRHRGLVRRNGRVALHILGADLAWSSRGREGWMSGWPQAAYLRRRICSPRAILLYVWIRWSNGEGGEGRK